MTDRRTQQTSHQAWNQAVVAAANLVESVANGNGPLWEDGDTGDDVLEKLASAILKLRIAD